MSAASGRDLSDSDGVIPFEPTPPAAATARAPARMMPPPRPGAATDPRCPHCGYSMKGLRSLKCPECGKTVSPSRLGRPRDLGVATQRAELRSTAIMLIVGLASAFTMYSISAGWAGAVTYAIIFAISVPAGLIAYFLCCLIWIGFDEPLPIVAFKLAAIYAVVDALAAALSFIPLFGLGLFNTLVTLIAYTSLLMSRLELDSGDAVAVAFVTFLVKVAMAIALTVVLSSVF